MDMKPAPETISQRLKDQLATAWLALYDVLRLGQVQVVIALVALIAIIVFLASFVPYWNRVLAYTRVEYKSKKQQSAR